ncbi:helix-turn-helix domain-containing protein [Achromobacter denitrificans]|jgi:cytoskeleton protein RodZ|uniref:Helix-turn-helix domain-containing protein n=1 Tax=Achromobacter denitrificans TaxID=32002 RepID=A0A427WXF4_ACHDE|nr:MULTISPECIES: helix-turn-helix domain-containing protein [Achromobacter]ASC62829.1 transcriptional regulator [Achromobacter denitrificans]MBV2157383.1 helix-turn-helix domain-containing protein [Achromobacter denitrificans]MDF3847002.1 helix-turn-helix domain-containing protein [Achromobacter denitrificans]MDF3861630.1 helix-turn-helix domain-containing protein [Achromobacter denitrificans]MDF3942367.1 helix-turn-helix domain-containing protein [Achromobacter denitrificans]
MTQDFASAVSETPAGAAGSVGSALRALRESKGWSLDEVSSRIKFSTKQIEALENEEWAALPTGVSLRGLVRNYARLLGADSQAIVDSLDPKARVTGPVKLSPGALHSAHSIPQSSADDDRSSSTSWGWLIAIVLVLAAGVAYAFWQGWLPQHWLPSDWLPKSTK